MRWLPLLLVALVIPGGMAVAGGGLEPGHGLLTVEVTPEAPSQVSVDGVPRNIGGIAGMQVPAGFHEVCASPVRGFLPDDCERVSVPEGSHVTTQLRLLPAGTLNVTTEPESLSAAIAIDGQMRDRGEATVKLTTGEHEVCFEQLASHTSPDCQTVTVEQSTTVDVVGTYDQEPAPDPSPEPTSDPTAEPTSQPTTQPTSEPTTQPTSTPEPGGANLLSLDQQTFGGSSRGWKPQGNSIIAQTDTASYDEAGALVVSVSKSGPWPDTSRTARVGTTPGKDDGVPVEAGADYSGSVRVLSLSGAADARCELRWYSAAGKQRILRTDPGAISTLTEREWTPLRCEAVAPAGAVAASLRILFDGVDYGRSFLADDAWLVAGALDGEGSPSPTPEPSTEPTSEPTQDPTPAPTSEPAPGPTPSPTATPTGQPEPDPSSVSHGAQLTPQNTGLRSAGYRYDAATDTFDHPDHGPLKAVNNITTTHDGQVIEGVDVAGSIKVAHDNVTIRNCRVQYTGSMYAIDAKRESPRGTTIEHCDITSLGSQAHKAFGVYISEGTVRWTNIERFQVGVFVKGANTRVEYTRVADPQAVSGTHGTGMSANQGASNLTFYRNYIEGNTSASLALYAHDGPFNGVTVADNLLDGGNNASFCLNAGNNKDSAGRNTNIHVTGNVFTRDAYPECGLHGPYFQWDASSPGAKWCNNRWANSQSPIGSSVSC